MNRILRYSAVVAIVMLIAANAMVADDFSSEKKKILDAWNEYLHTMDHYEGLLSVSSKASDGFSFQEEKSFDCSYPYALFQSVLADGTLSVRGYNPKYRFDIQQQNSTEWVVKDVEVLAMIPKVQWRYSEPENLAGEVISNTLASGLRVYPFWMPSLLQQEDFNITSISYFNANGKGMAQVEFVFAPSLDKTERLCVRSGKLVLLSDFNWLILNAQCNTVTEGKKGKINVFNEYNYDFRPPLLMTQHRDGIDGDVSFEAEIKLLNVRQANELQPKDFTLSHYGIPDPDFDGSQRVRPIRYILISGGLLLIVLALWLMYRKRQEGKNEKP